MELTITQNGALYFVHHKLPKPRASLFLPLRRRRAPKRQRGSLCWGAAEGLTEANPHNYSGRYGSLKSPMCLCVSITLPGSS
jgi:hypothetical protein